MIYKKRGQVTNSFYIGDLNMTKLVKKAFLHENYFVYAYEFDERLIENANDLMQINQRISDTFESIWEDAKNAVSHIFQESGTNSVNTATASAMGFYSGGPAGALATGSAERAVACFNCHVGEEVSQGLSTGIDIITAPADSTSN
jgi:hypothetical protein